MTKPRLERTRDAREKARQQKNKYKQRALDAEARVIVLNGLVTSALSAWLYSATPDELWSRFSNYGDGLGDQLLEACPEAQVPLFDTQPTLPEEEPEDETETS